METTIILQKNQPNAHWNKLAPAKLKYGSLGLQSNVCCWLYSAHLYPEQLHSDHSPNRTSKISYPKSFFLLDGFFSSGDELFRFVASDFLADWLSFLKVSDFEMRVNVYYCYKINKIKAFFGSIEKGPWSSSQHQRLKGKALGQIRVDCTDTRAKRNNLPGAEASAPFSGRRRFITQEIIRVLVFLWRGWCIRLIWTK